MGQRKELVYVDRSEILEGKLDKVKELIQELANWVEKNEPPVLAYHIYIDDSATSMSVFQVHADSASLERHMELGMPIFLKFQGSINLTRIDLYGKPNPQLQEILEAKAASLGTGGVVVHSFEAGFSRWRNGSNA